MRLLTTIIILMICLNSVGQTFLTKKHTGNYVDTESRYADYANGEGVTIQNSLPKGGGKYTDPAGNEFVYVVFWTRIINETPNQIGLTINFPADSFTVLPSADSYLKVFLPQKTMTLDKVSLYDYGLTDIKSFLDTMFYKPTTLQRIIKPKAEYLFYVGVLLRNARGPVRARLALKEQNIFYGINLLNSELISCGHMVVKD